jgi:nucleotide-binding universal stress UspA family protein
VVDEVRADAGAPAAAVAIGVRGVCGPAAAELVGACGPGDVLVVGSRGRGAARSALLGSVALHCATAAPCPVVVVHPRSRPADVPGRVVVGIDDPAQARSALAAAVAEAARRDARVEAVAAYGLPELWSLAETGGLPAPDALRERAEHRAEEVVSVVLGAGTPDRDRVTVTVVEGAAAAVLLDRASGAELLVVGSTSRHALSGLALGSVALHCVISAPCPVLVLHPGDVSAPPQPAEAAAAPIPG